MSDKLLDTNEEPFDISLDYALLDLQYMDKITEMGYTVPENLKELLF